MPNRRRFLQDAAALSSLLALRPDLSVAQPARAPLRVLVLGGTGYLGPHLIHVLTQRGHRVSMLNRGRRITGLTLFKDDFAKVEAIQGDRSTPTAYDNLKGKTFDAVIETSGNNLGWTRAAVEALKGPSSRYMYVSSTGVHWPYLTENIPETGPVPLKDDPPREPASYGVTKALSENAVREGFGERAILVRPGYIVGPGDLSDRWTYWPMRIARGGEILVPGKKTEQVQYVDVRDLSEFMIDLLEKNINGTFNVTGPGRRQTMEEFVYGVAAVTSVPLSWTWVDDYEWLKKYPLRRTQTGEAVGLTYSVPWMIPEGTEFGHMKIDNRKSIAAGLKFRPLAVTAMDTIAWRSGPDVPEPIKTTPRYVMTAEQEAAMLKAWKERPR